jgi:hypothetical protein
MRRIGFAAVLGEPWRIAAALACVVILTGCATAHVVHVPRATTDTPCVRPDPDEDLLVGVALSGGG